MQLTPLDPPSSNIYAEGYDLDTCLMLVQFKDAKGPKNEAYAYDGLSPEFYDEICIASKVAGNSFGKIFAKEIKPFPNKYPFKKVPLPAAAPTDPVKTYSFADVKSSVDSVEISFDQEFPGATDFTYTGPVPAIVAPAEILPPEDPEALKQAALALNEKAKAIEIKSSEDYELAATLVLAITRMRDALEKTFRPDIDKAHKVHAKACAALNLYDKPLIADSKRLKDGMAVFHQQEEARANAEARRLQEEEDRLAQAEAEARAQELQLADAVAAEERGETELATVILESKPLPIAPVYRAPVQVMSAVPRKVAGNSYVPKWVHEVTNLKLVPDQWKIADDKGLATLAKSTQGRVEVPGVRFYDAGNIRTSKRG
jgi:hypothetical protein